MEVQPYLFFNGRCEEALEFYRTALGAEVTMLMRFKESPEPPQPGMCPPGSEEKVMHASFRIGETTLMASDGRVTGQPEFKGFSLSISAPNDAQVRQLFTALADGGQVQMPLSRTFYASSFGMVADPLQRVLDGDCRAGRAMKQSSSHAACMAGALIVGPCWRDGSLFLWNHDDGIAASFARGPHCAFIARCAGSSSGSGGSGRAGSAAASAGVTFGALVASGPRSAGGSRSAGRAGYGHDSRYRRHNRSFAGGQAQRREEGG